MYMDANRAALTHLLTCPFQSAFFGLTNNYMENVYEQFFMLKYHGGWSFIEAYSLPIGLRLWFIKRLQKQFEDEKKQYDAAERKAKSGSRR